MHVILTGATGVVGNAVLHECLNTPSITRLSILSWRSFDLPKDVDVKKAEVIVHKDYAQYPDELLSKLKGAKGCIWAQGISQTEVNKEDYIRITYDYPMEAAKAFASLSNKFNFVYVSGEGADPTESTFTLFGKIKGRAESHLLALPSSSPTYESLRIYNARPAGIDPPFYHRPQPLFKRLVLISVVVPLLRVLAPSYISPTGPLSKVLVDLATGDGEPVAEGRGVEAGGRTLRNIALRRMGGL
ncbi:hypothetical protein BDQ17DRAFT_1362032 [Cyathus striatus]|nr:hypothetical protein BDQ17DRAFT_1362032 [Cyathus striatus]